MILKHLMLILTLLISSITQANALDPSLIHWLNQTIPAILSFSFKDQPTTYWKPYQKHFSKQGWSSFTLALQQANTIKMIQSHQLFPIIQLIPHHATNLHDTPSSLHLKIPAKIIYASENKAIIQKALIEIKLSSKAPFLIDALILQHQGSSKIIKIPPRGCALRTLP